MRAAVLVALLAAVSAAGGCGSRVRGMPDLAAVSGRVMLDGRPLANVAVIFSSENGHSSLGITDEQGRYSLKFIGNHGGAEIVKTTLTADVKPGNNTINFDLTTPQ